MGSGRQTLRDLAEEAKKRLVLLLICALGLAYLMSLTSSSVWINLPVATALIICCRYVMLDLDTRRKNSACNNGPVLDQSVQKRPVQLNNFSAGKPDKLAWRKKVDSPPVEAAIEQFTRHLASEWVTDLWYSRITPDKDGPEELVIMMNCAIGEISSRARDVNLINLLTRDIINIICNHLELYHSCQAKIGKEKFMHMSTDRRDAELRLTLAAENKLHPALFSANAEHRVLQCLVDGIISMTFKPEDLQCSFFRFAARELLACAVIRPVLNLANPRFINERIEVLAISYANRATKRDKPEEAPMVMQGGAPPMPSAEQLSVLMDPSSHGVELVQFKHDQSKATSDRLLTKNAKAVVLPMNLNNVGPISRTGPVEPKGNILHPLKSSSLLSDSPLQNMNSGSFLSPKNDGRRNNGLDSPGGEWAKTLDIISKQKNEVLAPEHFENLWTKGRNYRKMESVNQVAKQPKGNLSATNARIIKHTSVPHNSTEHHTHSSIERMETNSSCHNGEQNFIGGSSIHQERKEHTNFEEVGPDSESSYATEEDESNNVTGIDSPGTRVWESKNKGNHGSSRIHHPLEFSDFHIAKKKNKTQAHNPNMPRISSGRKRARSNSVKVPIWQEVERTSFLMGDDQDILNGIKDGSRMDELSDDSEVESLVRVISGNNVSSSQSSISTSESFYLSNYAGDNILTDSFLKLRCEVTGANIVKSGSGMFAVYSIAVIDANSNSWSIKRRFRHFEELHRRLKEFPEYILTLPPKHFLSSGLEVSVVRERCKLLDMYLKKLLEVPAISGSIEVWDFLSVDSQTYMFSDSLSIIQTLSVDFDGKSCEDGKRTRSSTEALDSHLLSVAQNSDGIKEDIRPTKKNHNQLDGLRSRKGNTQPDIGMNTKKVRRNLYQDDAGIDSESGLQNDSLMHKLDNPRKALLDGTGGNRVTPQTPETGVDSTVPIEWIPPNLSLPILNLVDVVFQLQDGGWIRRQAFWVAKQLLQLGMGDAFDDWLIEKIQFLRRGSVIASAIQRVEQILWPDGIFITKHPKRKPAAPVSSPGAMKDNLLSDEILLEAARRAKFVRELMIEKAPAALVSLVGRKEYERCAQDTYFFLQSSVCLKQLAFELLELLVLAAFPELEDIVRQCHEEKEQFGPLE